MYDEDYSEIIPNLYIGNKNATLELFPELNLVVNCTKNLNNSFPNTIRVPIDDSYDNNPGFLSNMIETNTLDIIHTNILRKQKVLVHCMAGAQRSCGVVACYLIKYYRMNPDEAINFIKNKRKIAFFGHITFKQGIETFYRYLLNN